MIVTGRTFIFGLSGLSLLAMTACSQLPANGPNYHHINANATTALQVSAREVVDNYALVDLNVEVLANLSKYNGDSPLHSFRSRQRGAPDARIGPGDILQVSIFESSTGGLFFGLEGGGQPGSGNRPGRFITLPNQTIGSAGTINVPYGGRIYVKGRRVSDIERAIEKKLAERAIEPQVLVSIVEKNSSSVAVVGDALNGANRFQITGAGERILDMISRAGGVRFPAYEVFVTLQRHGRKATVHFPRLIRNPKENLYVVPGDTIYVYQRQQKYIAIGALGAATQTEGLTGQFEFGQERLSLNEAIAKAGGLQDTRANPAQVFLYRVEYRKVLEHMGVDLRKFADDQKLIPVIYRANFRDPSAFFVTQKFAMRDKDLVYVANADSIEVVKFLDYIRAITSTVSGGIVDAKDARDAISGWTVLQ